MHWKYSRPSRRNELHWPHPQAAAVLSEGRYAEEVRAAEAEWQQAGIQSVPAIVINQKHLISGGQPPEVFERALRQIAGSSVP